MTAPVLQGAYINRSWNAGADLSGAQFTFVKLDSGNVIQCAAVGDKPVGVLQNKPASGHQAEVLVLGPSIVMSGDAITAGDTIGTNASGAAITKDVTAVTAEWFCGRAIGAATAAGQQVEAMIDCLNPWMVPV